jgi:hypothetical protein
MKRTAAPVGRTRRSVRCSSTEEQRRRLLLLQVAAAQRRKALILLLDGGTEEAAASQCRLGEDGRGLQASTLSLRPTRLSFPSRERATRASFPLPVHASCAFPPGSRAISTRLARFFFDSAPIKRRRARRRLPRRAQRLIECLPLKRDIGSTFSV